MKQIKLGCLVIFLAPFVAFFAYVTVTVIPVAWATERMATKRFAQARVVDADTGKPIENAVVLFDASYRTYRTGIMHYRTPGRRAYRVRTSNKGVARIPLKYFLVRGLQFDRVFLWCSNMRSADLPERYLIAALRDDYSTAQVKMKKQGKEFPFADQKQMPELRLVQRAKLSRIRGGLYNTDVRLINSKFDANRTKFYYLLDIAKQEVARCASINDADFVIEYKPIPAGQGDFSHRLPTKDPRVEKVLWSIEAVGDAGLAIDPQCQFKFEQLSRTKLLDFKKRMLFENRLDHQPKFEVLVVRSREGTHTAAIEVRPKSIEWLWSNPMSEFRHARVHTGAATKYCLTYGLTRDFDPTQKPDYRHWKKAPQKKRLNHGLRLKFVPFKGLVPVAPDDA